MLALKSAEAVKKSRKLFDLIEKRRECEKEEKALKEWFKAKLGGEDGTIKIDRFLIVVETTEGTKLDGKALREKLGDGIKEFESPTTSQKLTITEA